MRYTIVACTILAVLLSSHFVNAEKLSAMEIAELAQLRGGATVCDDCGDGLANGGGFYSITECNHCDERLNPDGSPVDPNCQPDPGCDDSWCSSQIRFYTKCHKTTGPCAVPCPVKPSATAIVRWKTGYTDVPAGTVACGAPTWGEPDNYPTTNACVFLPPGEAKCQIANGSWDACKAGTEYDPILDYGRDICDD